MQKEWKKYVVGALMMPKSIETIMDSVREPDKRIIHLILSNGGQAFEKDIRSTLYEPRTII